MEFFAIVETRGKWSGESTRGGREGQEIFAIIRSREKRKIRRKEKNETEGAKERRKWKTSSFIDIGIVKKGQIGGFTLK